MLAHKLRDQCCYQICQLSWSVQPLVGRMRDSGLADPVGMYSFAMSGFSRGSSATCPQRRADSAPRPASGPVRC